MMDNSQGPQGGQVPYPTDINAAEYLLSSPMKDHVPLEAQQRSHPHHYFRGKSIDEDAVLLKDAQSRSTLSYGQCKKHVAQLGASLSRLVPQASWHNQPSEGVVSRCHQTRIRFTII